ncbi:MAG: lamin tail domain-containing protein, partial [Chthoniobacteraceae bacterium]
IDLVKPGAPPDQDIVMATTTYAAAPTPAQNFLRITELSYNPLPPTAAESAALPGVSASDFEFIEFVNTSGSPLNIAGVRIDKGVTFTFPAGFTLQPGQRCVAVSLLAAYNLRYAGSGAVVAGQFEGNLANDGETIALIDAVGESIFEFKYDPLWYGVPKIGDPGALTGAAGYSLVARLSSPVWDDYERPIAWALGDTIGGTPGTGDASFANVFVGWSKDFFTPFEEAIATYGGLTADPDNDGRNNFEEFIFGGHPKVPEQRPLPVSSLVPVEGADYLAITFDRRHNTLDTTCVVEASSDLVTWTIVNLPVGAFAPPVNGMERVTFRDSVPHGPGQRFLRVRATR